MITLKDVMFWPIDVPLKIDETLAQQLPLTTQEFETQALVEQAQQRLPSVALAEGTMKNARLALKTARWQMLPTVSLYGGWSSSYFTYPGKDGYVPTPYFDQIKNNGGEYVQLSVSIPIYNRLSNHTNISKRKNALDRAQADYEQTLQTVEAEVRRAVADRDGTADALRQADTRAALQQEAFALNGKRFEQGLISSIEYQTASNLYLNALAEQMNARLQYFIKNSVVKYYGGTPYLQQLNN